MVKRKAISNDTRVLEGDKPDGFKHNFGGGLHAKVWNNEKFYEVRLCLDGFDTTRRIGKCAEISIEEARRIAEQYRSKLAKLRTKRRQAIVNGKLKARPKRMARLCESLKDLKTLWSFIQGLWNGFGIPYETRMAIWLQLLIPTKPHELWVARRKDAFGVPGQILLSHYYSSGRGRDANSDRQFAFVSRRAVRYLDDLRNHTGDTDYLFPTLAGWSTAEREKHISEAMKIAMADCPIGPRELSSFFYAVICEHSQFRPEFIATLSERGYCYKPVNSDLYRWQILFVLDWWGECLEGLKRMSKYEPGLAVCGSEWAPLWLDKGLLDISGGARLSD